MAKDVGPVSLNDFVEAMQTYVYVIAASGWPLIG